MNPDDPESAQRIVADYAQVLERDLEAGSWPAVVDALPYPKQTIMSAIRTSVGALAARGQLTGDLREFLETAYVALADYVSADLARLMTEYQQAGTALAASGRLPHERTSAAEWQTLAGTGALAGEIARMIAEEADQLRDDFRRFAL